MNNEGCGLSLTIQDVEIFSNFNILYFVNRLMLMNCEDIATKYF